MGEIFSKFSPSDCSVAGTLDEVDCVITTFKQLVGDDINDSTVDVEECPEWQFNLIFKNGSSRDLTTGAMSPKSGGGGGQDDRERRKELFGFFQK